MSQHQNFDLLQRERLNKAAICISWFLHGTRWVVKSSESWRI